MLVSKLGKSTLDGLQLRVRGCSSERGQRATTDTRSAGLASTATSVHWGFSASKACCKLVPGAADVQAGRNRGGIGRRVLLLVSKARAVECDGMKHLFMRKRSTNEPAPDRCEVQSDATG